MSTEDHHFETLDELAEWVIRNHYQAEKRMKLKVDSNWEFIDPEAGEKWLAEKDAIPYVSMGNSEARKEYDEKIEELNSRKPDQHVVKRYQLWESSGGWGYKTLHITFSIPLGEMVDGVWTKKHSWGDHYDNIGSISLKGLLKRLGKTDVGNKIKEIEKAKKLQDEKNSRNYARREIREQAAKLIELLRKNEKNLGLNPGMDLQSLTEIKDEE